MVVEGDFQFLDDQPEPRGGRYVGGAGLRSARGVVVRQHYPPRVEVESPAHGTTQRYPALGTAAAGVEVFGDVEPLPGEEQDHDALLAPAAQAADEVVAELRRSGVGRLAAQRLARGRFGQPASADYGGGDVGLELARLGQRFGQRVGRGRIDRTQRPEPAQQPARYVLAAGTRIGGEERRQDG